MKISPTNLFVLYKQKHNLSKECLKDNKDNVRTSIFYINDFHGKAINMERAITASKAFDSFVPKEKTDKLKLSAGDIMLGEDLNINSAAKMFLKTAGISAGAVGNHECDLKTADTKNFFSDITCKLLACNFKKETETGLSKAIQSSIAEEHNGNKYGLIGTMPSDLALRTKSDDEHDLKFKPDDIDETINDVQKEADKLKSAGINKIILLSHSGYTADKRIAQETSGIDIIIGGHSHDLIKGVTEGENLLYSKTGEPVVITQAGHDGNNFGILDVEFDKDGLIKKVKNNVAVTEDFGRFAPAKYMFDKILGKSEVIGFINTAPPVLKNCLLDPSPLANFALDAIRQKTGAEIALVGAGNIRGNLEKGDVDSASVSELSPFKNKLINAYYSEKEIVDALKHGAMSFRDKNSKPGIMYVSGLKYDISTNGEISNLRFVNKDGSEEAIDVNNPREDKQYLVAINEFFGAGNDGYTMLNKIDNAAQYFDYDLNLCVEDYIRNHKGAIDIVDDGRLKITEA